MTRFVIPKPASILACLAFAAFLFVALADGRAQVLYDGALGLPTEQGWSYIALGTATQTQTNNGVLLDTSGANSTQAGYSRSLSGLLNRASGFTLLFSAQMLSEAHASSHRAGFSVILLGDDARGIELGLWTDKVFAQSESPLFTHAEDTNYLTTTSVDYGLTFHATNYSLTANGAPILTGPVRDYSAFNGPINPYRTPDFLFFGDDTTSAAAVCTLKKVVLVTPPELVGFPDSRITWAGVPNLTYTMLSSSNLIDWVAVESVTSATSVFVFTNASSTLPRFFRVAFP